ncbi:MAG: NAD(P)-binding protein, partial [Parasporobacterium sp.]|nr:NAD(P)-binding protein [Parasporobacterium sp.]
GNLEVGATFEGTDVSKVQFASSELPNVWNAARIHREMTVEEIKRIVEAMIDTAELAKKAGIDGVEIHAVHEGYLLDQFAISNTNHRTDEYGGSLKNRMRFATDVIRGIKERCGDDFPVAVRYGAVSKMKGFNQGALPMEAYEEFGRTLEESPAVARMLVDAGCDLLDVDNGSYDSWYWAHPPVYMPEACNLPEAQYIKSFVDVPVICAGRMENPDIAAKAIEHESIDAVGIARQFLADPEYTNKIMNGELDSIRPCIACHNGCLGSLLAGRGVSCALRPITMNEDRYNFAKADKPAKVMVVGGGIGGMEAARLLAKCGNDVSLYESTDRLGGAFIAAAAPSFKNAEKKLIAWYER